MAGKGFWERIRLNKIRCKNLYLFICKHKARREPIPAHSFILLRKEVIFVLRLIPGIIGFVIALMVLLGIFIVHNTMSAIFLP